jgi:hypothetical protein
VSRFVKTTYDIYTIQGDAGCVLKSYERGVPAGTVRYIGKELLYAWKVYRAGWLKPAINWVFVNQEHDHPKHQARVAAMTQELKSYG